MASNKKPKKIPETVKLSPSFDLLIPATKIIRDNIWVFFVLMIFPYLLLNSVFIFDIGVDVTRAANNTISSVHVHPSFLLIVLFSLAYTLLAFAPLTYTYTMAATGREVPLREAVTKGLQFFWRLIGLNLCVGFLVLGGLILLIVPGVIMLRRYYLSPYYLIDQNLSISDAMKKSALQSKRFSSSIYGILGVSIGFSMLSFVPLVGAYLGSVLQLLYAPAAALRYHEIKKAYL